MKVYTCEIFDGHLLDTVMVGVFSTLAKAQEAGGLYLAENANTAHLLDWDHDTNTYTDWYQDDSHYNYTRVICECEIDTRLAQANRGPVRNNNEPARRLYTVFIRFIA